MPSVTTSTRVSRPTRDSPRTRYPTVSPTRWLRVAASRRAEARAAIRRGSSITTSRPSSQWASKSASGTRVVLPAPGGALEHGRRRLAEGRDEVGQDGVDGKGRSGEGHGLKIARGPARPRPARPQGLWREWGQTETFEYEGPSRSRPMTLKRRLRVLWERYVAPTRLERDAGFRAVLDAATVIGTRVAGLFGVFALVGAVVAVVVTTLLAGGGMVTSAGRISEALSDKLFVFAAAAGFLFVARFRPGLRLGRWLLAVYVLLAAGFLAADDVGRSDVEFLAAWLSLLLFLTVGTVPFQPVQTLVLGLVVTVLHTGIAVMLGDGGMIDDGEAVRRLA